MAMRRQVTTAGAGSGGTIATLLDVPLLPFLRTISSWGLGLVDLIEAAERKRKTENPA